MKQVTQYTPQNTGKPHVKRDLDAQISSTLFDDFDRFEHFFSTHWKAFCWTGAAIVAAVAAWGVVELIQLRNQNSAMAILNSAKSTDELVKAIEEFGSDDIRANDARLRLSGLLFAAGNYVDAVEQLNAVLSSDCPPEQRAQVSLNLAYLLEHSGKIQESADKFAAIALLPELPMRDMASQANFNAGRLYLQLGNMEQAKLCLEKSAAGYDISAIGAGVQEPFWRQQAISMLNGMNGASK